MKIKCDFCKTEYALNKIPATPVQCAICGHVWTVKSPAKKNSFFTFLAALCALLSAVIFSVVIISKYNSNKLKNTPLIAQITATNVEKDEDGVSHIKVSGMIRNQSTEIYGAPDLLIYMHDKDGKIIGAPERFTSPVTLLDSGVVVNFEYTLKNPANGIKTVSVKIADYEK